MNTILSVLGVLVTSQLSPVDEHNAVMYSQQLIMNEMIEVCVGNFPEERLNFETTFDLWARVNRKAIRDGREVAILLGRQEGLVEVEQAYIDEAQELAGQLAAAPAEVIREYCDNIIDVLKSES